MKRFALLLLLCVFTVPNVSAQKINYEEQLIGQEAVDYWNLKYKKKRGTARGFLFSGLGMIGIGAIVVNNAGGSDAWGEAAGAAALVTIGTVSSLVSIPFYIKANSFKRKAKEAQASMNVSLGTIRSPQRTDFGIGVSYSF